MVTLEEEGFRTGTHDCHEICQPGHTDNAKLLRLGCCQSESKFYNDLHEDNRSSRNPHNII